ncbi:MAG: hypothetical protein WBN17_13305 [Aureibaculum sp.]|jgi:hypothetical protein
MDKSKILTIVASVIGVIGVFFLVRVIMAGDDAIESSLDLQSSIVDPFIMFARFLLIATAVLTLAISAVNLVKHPDALKKALTGIVVLGVLLAIAYFMASDDAVTNSVGKVIKDGEAGPVSKWVSALINFTGILGLLGLLAIAGGFFKSLIK